MNIRPLRATEVETVVDELWRPFAEGMAERSDRFELAEDANEQMKTNINSGIRQDNVVAFVAETDEELAGYILLEIRSPPPIFTRGLDCAIDQLYVKPSARRDGVGEELVDRAAAIAEEKGAENLVLTLDAGNQAALEFYDGLGFEVWRHRLIRDI